MNNKNLDPTGGEQDTFVRTKVHPAISAIVINLCVTAQPVYLRRLITLRSYLNFH